MLCRLLGIAALTAVVHPAMAQTQTPLHWLIAKHARENGVPEALVHRVIIRESRYNPRAVGRGGALGLMQIKYATARSMGYAGPASGLLDPDTNLRYAVRYLAGAYRAAGGHPGRAVSYYASGYYRQAKRMEPRFHASERFAGGFGVPWSAYGYPPQRQHHAMRAGAGWSGPYAYR